MSSHRRPDTRRLPAACPRCLRNLRLTHTLTVSRHSSTERPASFASALSAATVSGLHSLPLTRHASHSSTERPASFASAATASGLLHSSQARQLHGEHAQKASTRETRLLHMSQMNPLWLAHRRASTCPRSHPTAIPDSARSELQAASGWHAPRHGLSNTHTSRSKRPSPEQRPARCWPAGAPARDRAPAAG